MSLWYVIQTKAKKEEEVASHLSTKGVEILSPLIDAFLMRNGSVGDRTQAPLCHLYFWEVRY